MFKLSKKEEYGLMVLKRFMKSGEEELVSAKEMSERYQIPFDTVSRVMQQLAQKGILHSEKGVQGGYSLNTDLAKFSFYDYLSVLQGEITLVKCGTVLEASVRENVKSSACEKMAFCEIKAPVFRLQKKLENFTRSLMLRDLLSDSGLLSESSGF